MDLSMVQAVIMCNLVPDSMAYMLGYFINAVASSDNR